MFNRLGKFILTLSEHILPAPEQPRLHPAEDYFTMVERARREWQGARERFDQVSDPDLIDHAIFDLEATERRYVYLLKKAREEGATIYSPANEGGI